MVGGPHRVFVVFDDDDRVAEVAEFGECVEQPLVVARVEADRRFVEDVEHADEAAADLAGEADALRFAAGERGGGAFEREIFEADVEQEAEPAADFFEDLLRDLFFVAFEDDVGEELDGVGRRRVAETAGSVRASMRACITKRELAVCTVTARPERISRRPRQSGQRMMLMYCSSWRIWTVLLLVFVFFQQLGDEAVERAAVFLGRFAAPGVRDVLVAGAPEPDVALLSA